MAASWTPRAAPAAPWNVGWFSDGASQLLPAPDGGLWLVSTFTSTSTQTHVLRFDGTSWTALPDIAFWPDSNGWFGAAFVGGVLHVVGRDSPGGGASRLIVVSYNASSGALALVSSTPIATLFFPSTPVFDSRPYRAWAGVAGGKLWVMSAAIGGPSYFVGYDTALGTWEAHSILASQFGRAGLVADPAGGLWTVGGYVSTLGTTISDIATFAPASATYTTVGNLPDIVQDPAVAIIGRTLHILGGFFGGTSEQPSWYTFDLDSHALNRQPDLPTSAASYGSEAGALRNDLYFGGGFSDVLNKDVGFWVSRGGLPPLRQYPRDDFVGGAPRQGHGSTSVQASARQGWRGTYR